MTVTLTTIIDRVRENVISVPEETEDRLEGWIQEAQRRAETAFNWIAGQELWDFGTVAGTNLISDVTSFFLWPLGDPWYVTGDVGRKVELEWLPSLNDRAKDYIESTNSDHRGAPKALMLVTSSSYLPARIMVYPKPDAGNIIGEFSTAGEYAIRVPYHSRGQTLSTSTQTNYLTENPELALFLEEWASSKAMLFNHDYDNANAMLVQAVATLKEAKKIEKKRKVPILRWTPRRDVHARRQQRRMS